MIPPKPTSRPRKMRLWGHFKRFRRDILSAQPAHLFGAWMAEFKTPFFKSYLVNDPDVVDRVLRKQPENFPKSERVARGLHGLLGRHSVFVTNGAEWKRQRRILDPAFAHGRIKDSYPAMLAAVQAAVARLPSAPFEAQAFTSHLAADVIFRTLFSVPIEDAKAQAVFEAFQAYQARQPIVNAAAFVPLLGRIGARKGMKEARVIRELIADMVAWRQRQIVAGKAPDDLATRIMTAQDPDTGACLGAEEMVDQVAIFFLAGHETSASALAWALYLLAASPEIQSALWPEVGQLPSDPGFAQVAALRQTRCVFQETLRLYPPVPMMVRQTACPMRLRDRDVGQGAQVVLSPWHLQRHTRIWRDPDAFCPARFDAKAPQSDHESIRRAYLPFSAGPRVCVGAGFAMTEGVLSLALLARAASFALTDAPAPVPQAQLTLRSANGIWLQASPR